MEPAERKDSLLDRDRTADGQGPTVALLGQGAVRTQIRDGLAHHHPGRRLGQRYCGRLGHERHSARRPRVGFEDVQHVTGQGELDVQQPSHADTVGDRQRGGADAFNLGPSQGDRRQRAGGIAGVDTGLLDVFHDPAQEQVGPVVQGVDVDLDGVVQEAVDEDGVFRVDLGGPVQEPGEHLVVIHDLHPTATQHVTGSHEHRVSDLVGDRAGLVERERRAVFGGGQTGLAQHPAERAPVLGQVDALRRCADDRKTQVLEGLRQSQRGLAPQLHDDSDDLAGGGLGLVDLEDVLEGERLEVQPVGGVVVGGHRLGVAVDHDGLVPLVAQGQGSVHARVVELDALADAVGTAAEDHHLGQPPGLDLGLLVVRGVVIGRAGGELRCAGVHRLVDRPDSQRLTHASDHGLVQIQDPTELSVGEPVALGQSHQVRAQHRRGADLLGDLVQDGDLIEEPRVDAGGQMRLLDAGAGPHCLLDQPQSAISWRGRNREQWLWVRGSGTGPVELGILVFQRPKRLLQRLCEVAADGHGFADALHGGGQPVVSVGELLECEPGNLDHDVVQGRFERGRRLGSDVVGDLVQAVPDRKPSSDLGDREPGGLRCQGTGTGHPWIHLDHDDATVGGVDGELDVASTCVHTDGADDVDADVTQPLVFPIGQCERRSHGDRVAGVHPHGVQILDRTDHHDVVVVVPHQFELVLLPSQDRLLQQHLGGGTRGQPGAGDQAQLVGVVRES